jgi:spermidine synthase
MLRTSVYLLFFASGISGLVYEIIWMRKLTLIFGCTTYATSAVLTAFMGGLALGSFLLGRVADRQSNPLRLYGLIEIGIGLSTILVMLLLLPVMDSAYVWAFRVMPQAGAGIIAIRFILAILILIVPTTLMGGTLPIISRYFVERLGILGHEIGKLYAINTLGATLGCFAAGFILIRSLGETDTVAIAVGINLAVGSVMLLLPGRVGAARLEEGPETAPVDCAPGEPAADRVIGKEPSIAPSPSKARAALWAFGLAGFASLAYEVIWTRSLINVIGSDVYCFTVILTTFLLGIGLGSFVIARFADRIRNLYLAFGLAEIAIGCLALATIPLTEALPGVTIRVMELLAKAELARTPFAMRTVSMFGAAFLIFLGPTVLMGAVFPLVNKIWHQNVRCVGRRVGDVYSVNTLGTILGAAAAGFLILPWFGIAGSIVAISTVNLGVGAIVCGLERRSRLVTGLRWLGTAAAVGSLAAIFVLGLHHGVPGYITAYDRQSLAIPYYKETPAATLYVKEFNAQRNVWGYPIRKLVINRHPTAHNTLLDIVVHKVLAHVPLLLHDNPQRALVVGFGLGSTSYSMLRHADVRVDCVELLGEEIDTATYFARENHDIINTAERFRLIINDGRNYILATEEVYDVISVNAIDPRLSPALYTWDFYELCRSRMTDEGLMALWLPTYCISRDAYFSIYKSFLQVFPHSFVLYCNRGHFVVIGSSRPIRIDLERLRARMAEPPVRESLAEVCLEDPLVLLSTFILTPEGLERMVGGAPLNTDLNPTVEFDREEIGDLALNPEFFQPVLAHKSNILPYLDPGPGEEGRAAAEQVARYARQLRTWMRGQLANHTQSRSAGLALMIRALNLAEGNLMLKAFLVAYSPELLEAPYSNPYLETFVDTFEEVLAARPSMVMVHHYLAWAYSKQRHPERALEQAEIMARLRPDDWLYTFNLGTRYQRAGRTEDARACFERILQMTAGRAWGHYGLAVLLTQAGDGQAAREHLREALREDPEFDEARKLLREYRARRPPSPA